MPAGPGGPLKPFKVSDIHTARMWFLRIASLIGVIAAIVAIGVFVRKGDTFSAGLLIFAAVACSILFARSWTGALFDSLEAAKHHVQGVEGDHRHEWYAFKGQRVRVFLDA